MTLNPKTGPRKIPEQSPQGVLSFPTLGIITDSKMQLAKLMEEHLPKTYCTKTL